MEYREGWRMADWYGCTEQEVMEALRTGPGGISDQEAEERLLTYGENVLREQGRLQWWQVFLAQFKDLLVVILIGAAGVSMVTGDPESALVIFLVLLLNAVLGTVQHQRAEKTLDSLKQLSSPEARVIRQGRAMTIPSAGVVPGDLLLLETGDMSAADGRLLEVHGLTVNESSLTGESLSVEKQRGIVKPGQINGPAAEQTAVPAADQTNMIFAGSLVTSGRGAAVVTATGMDTEIGRIAALMNEASPQKTPLQASLDRFSGHLAAAIMAVCALVFAISLYRREPVLDALMFSVALAVAAIPEALSSIVTIVQAMGTQKMAREQAIIKDLKAVESLGCVSVICSDKTGTLTQNRMEAERIYLNHQELVPAALKDLRERQDRELFLEAAILNNNAPAGGGAGEGDPMEAALLRMAEEGGQLPERLRLQCPRLEEVPFDSSRKMMITVNETSRGRILFAKGAVDVLLGCCSRLANPASGHGGAVPCRPLTASDISRILDQNARWSSEGLRILALACCPAEEVSQGWNPAEEVGRGWNPAAEVSPGWNPAEKVRSGRNLKESGREKALIFLGMIAMMDPPRPESRGAVASARQAGIRPVMITGDHKVTAMAIARRIGIFRDGDLALTGAELDLLADEDLDRSLPRISVYARVSPEHKIRIVEAWQKRGQIVAMTGDGVNDAPALKKADIGVAMGVGGTEVSKDAASMILADDNFATIIKAVANGRNVYRNIKNAIQFLLSGNMAGILCVLYTSLRCLPLPFAPVHLLFINLLTDSLPAIAIGMEPAEDGLLKEPPRDPGEGILTSAFVRDLLLQGGLIAGATMWAYSAGLQGGGPGTASTMAFSTLTLARLFHGFNCRSRRSIFHLGLLSNYYSLAAFGLGVILLCAVLFVPGLQIMFAAADLGAGQVLLILAAAFLPTLVIQAVKMAGESVE